MPNLGPRIVTHLIYDHQAEEAVNFYVSIFPDSKIFATSHCGPNEPGGAEGTVRTVSFQLMGHQFLAVNGGPHFKFSDAISLLVQCDTQEEIDYYWEKLTEGGKEVECGWLTDKFGVSWQVAPTISEDMLTSPDPVKAQRALAAYLKMKKIDIEELTSAFRG